MLQGSSKEVGGVDIYTLAFFEAVSMVLVGKNHDCLGGR